MSFMMMKYLGTHVKKRERTTDREETGSKPPCCRWWCNNCMCAMSCITANHLHATIPNSTSQHC